MCFGQGRRPAPSLAVIIKITFRLRKAEAKNMVPGIISAAGAVIRGIVIYYFCELDPPLFLWGEGRLQKLTVKPPPQIALLPGVVRILTIVRLAVKTVTTYEEGLIAVNLQNQPFNGLFGTVVVLMVAAEFNVLPDIDLHGLDRRMFDALYSKLVHA